MAVITTSAFNQGPWNRDTTDVLVIPLVAARTWVNGDTVRGPGIFKQGKIGGAKVALDPIDTNATPTATGALYVATPAGAVAQNLITLTAAQMKAGGVYDLNVIAGLGYTIPAEGYYIEFAVTAAVATAASASLKFAVTVTALNYPNDDPTRST